MSKSANHCLYDLEEKELKNLAYLPGPKDYLAFDEMARRTQEDPLGWEPTGRPAGSKAPHAELAFLELSQHRNFDRNYELQREQDARIEELECEVGRDPQSLANQCHNKIVDEIDLALESFRLVRRQWSGEFMPDANTEST